MDGGATSGEDGGPAQVDKQSEARRVTLLEDSYLDFRIPAIRVREPLRARNTKKKRGKKRRTGRGEKSSMDNTSCAGMLVATSGSRSRKVGGGVAASWSLAGAEWDRWPSY